MFRGKDSHYARDDSATKKLMNRCGELLSAGSDKNTLHNTRFAVALKEFGMEVDGVYFESLFQKYLQEAHHYVEGAYEVIAQLANHYHLYVVSNGVTLTQNKRLVDADLAQYFKGIFISEQTGYQNQCRPF